MLPGADGVTFFSWHKPLPPVAVGRPVVRTNGYESMRAARCGWQRVAPGL